LRDKLLVATIPVLLLYVVSYLGTSVSEILLNALAITFLIEADLILYESLYAAADNKQNKHGSGDKEHAGSDLGVSDLGVSDFVVSDSAAKPTEKVAVMRQGQGRIRASIKHISSGSFRKTNEAAGDESCARTCVSEMRSFVGSILSSLVSIGSKEHGDDEAALRYSARTILLIFPVGTTAYFMLASNDPPGSSDFLQMSCLVGLAVAMSSSIVDLAQRFGSMTHEEMHPFRLLVRSVVLLLIWTAEWGFAAFL
jgi:hypothetical protein